MTRLIYFFWVLVGLALFLALLLFVLANDQALTLNFLVPGWQLSAPSGVLVLSGFALGATLGLLVGMGVSLIRRTSTQTRSGAARE